MALAKSKAKARTDYTVDEYLETERAARTRHEFIDGEIHQMTSESDAHGDISVNLISEVRFQLKNKDCRARGKGAKIKSGSFKKAFGQSAKRMFSYPDLVVVSGKVLHHDRQKDVILNPKVIIEVLSDSTEIYDRGEKFIRYQVFNETLTDYILVSQNTPQIEHFVRQDIWIWTLYTYIGLDAVCPVESIECVLDLKEVYDRIKFSKKTLEFLKEIENI